MTRTDVYAASLQRANRRHFDRLRRIERQYATGRIDYDELQRREAAEYKRYDAEIEAIR